MCNVSSAALQVANSKAWSDGKRHCSCQGRKSTPNEVALWWSASANTRKRPCTETIIRKDKTGSEKVVYASP